MTTATLAAAILALIQTFTPPHGEDVNRGQRYEVIATAIAVEARTPREAAAILTIWHGETRLAVAVHRGERGRWGSDDGKARCLGQIHNNRSMSEAQWTGLAGLDLMSTRRCAAATLRLLKAMKRRCRNGYPGSFSGYASGNCQPNKYAARAKTMARFEAALWRRAGQ